MVRGSSKTCKSSKTSIVSQARSYSSPLRLKNGPIHASVAVTSPAPGLWSSTWLPPDRRHLRRPVRRDHERRFNAGLGADRQQWSRALGRWNGPWHWRMDKMSGSKTRTVTGWRFLVNAPAFSSGHLSTLRAAYATALLRYCML